MLLFPYNKGGAKVIIFPKLTKTAFEYFLRNEGICQYLSLLSITNFKIFFVVLKKAVHLHSMLTVE